MIHAIIKSDYWFKLFIQKAMTQFIAIWGICWRGRDIGKDPHPVILYVLDHFLFSRYSCMKSLWNKHHLLLYLEVNGCNHFSRKQTRRPATTGIYSALQFCWRLLLKSRKRFFQNILFIIISNWPKFKNFVIFAKKNLANKMEKSFLANNINWYAF